jgi:hypothetical protein
MVLAVVAVVRVVSKGSLGSTQPVSAAVMSRAVPVTKLMRIRITGFSNFSGG